MKLNAKYSVFSLIAVARAYIPACAAITDASIIGKRLSHERPEAQSEIATHHLFTSDFNLGNRERATEIGRRREKNSKRWAGGGGQK